MCEVVSMYPIKKMKPIVPLFAFLLFFSASFLFLGNLYASTVQVSVSQSMDRYPAGGSFPVEIRITTAKGWYIHGPEKDQNFLIPTVLSFPATETIRIEEIKFPAPEKITFSYAKDPIEVFSGEISVKALLMVEKEATPGNHILKGELSYQACSENSCLPPEMVTVSISVSVVQEGAVSNRINEEIFRSETEKNASGGASEGFGFGAGMLLALIGIFFGGLALNLTPCVYPLIPITVSYFGGRSDAIKGRAIVHGVLYILGLAFTNSVLGVVAALSGGMLGIILQNPVVLFIVAGIMVGLALSFFGLWEIRIPSSLTQMASRNFGGFFGTFFMGLTLGIVAAPCLGPFILGLLTYLGQKGDPFLGFLYFFVLSIGMGLPLAVLAVFSGAIDKLPMSGTWMVWIRKALGWVLIGMAGYMLQPLFYSELARSVMYAGILSAAGIHLGWFDKSKGARTFVMVKRALGLVLIGGAVTLLVMGAEKGETIQWIPYSESILTESKKRKKPVILDFYADWCGPCKALEKNVFNQPDVVALSKEFTNVKVDLTTRHEAQELLQKKYGIRGVPTVIFMKGDGLEERKLRIESYVGPGEMLKRMRELLTGK